jgi:hypothetical protein
MEAAAGYTASFEDSEGAGAESGTDTGPRDITDNLRNFDFINVRNTISPTGIDADNIAALLPLPALTILLLIAQPFLRAASRRRKRARDAKGNTYEKI